MKIALLFPPQWRPENPDLTIPQLSAFLKTYGYTIIQRDLNIEAYDYFLSRDRLESYLMRIAARLSRLERQSCLSAGDQMAYAKLAAALLRGKSVAANVEAAKAVLRDGDRFYQPRDYFWSREVIQQALAIVSAAFYPTEIDWLLFQMQHTWAIDQVIENTRNREENPFIEFFEERVVPYILEEDPQLIGITLINFGQIVPAFTLARLLKENGYKGHITVFGNLEDEFNLTRLIDGYKAERKDGREKLFTLCDSFIVYESEHPMLELARRLEGTRDFRLTPNLAYWDGQKVQANKPFYIENVNALPTPDYSEIPFHLYLQPEPVAVLRTSRGCYWDRCAFCTITSNHLRYRARNVAEVVKDMREMVEKYGVKFIRFRDEAAAPKWLWELSRQILHDGLKVKWSIRCRFERGFSPELCRMLLLAGCHAVWFGLESASQRVLTLMDKGTEMQHTEQILRWCAEAGIRVNMTVIVGFPGETEEEALETVEFLTKNRDMFDTYTYTPFLLLKGSIMEQEPERFGIEEVGHFEGDCLAYRYAFRTREGQTHADVVGRHMRLSKRLAENIGEKDAFMTPTHLYLYQIFADRSRLRGLALPHREMKTAEIPVLDELSESVPCLPLTVSVRKFRFNISKLPKGSSQETPPSMMTPEEVCVAYLAESRKTLLLSKAAFQLLELCDGQRSFKAIVDLCPQQNAAQVGTFLRMLLEKGLLSLRAPLQAQVTASAEEVS